jgi:hypothetical protein
MSTIVSAFVNNMNTRNDRKIENYLSLGQLLLKARTPKIIFIDNETYSLIKHYENDNTKIIPFEKREIYLYNYLKDIHSFSIDTDFPEKDSLEFMFTMCNKTEWVRKAIEYNFFNTENFIWLDFGIRHVFQCNDEDFIEKIEKVGSKEFDSIRFGTIWDLNADYYLNGIDIYRRITWYFAGGVFGGNKKILLDFSNKTKDKCLQIIRERGSLMWEVNIWYLVFKETFNELNYSFYNCNHNDSIIDNY